MMFDKEEDLIAAAQLALEDSSCNVIKVGLMIRETLGHRDAKSTINDAIFALYKIGTTRAIAMIEDYRVQNAKNVAYCRNGQRNG